MKGTVFPRVLGLSAVLVVALPRTARAEAIRAHGTASFAASMGGYQSREIPFGGAGLLAAEWPFVPALGVEFEVGTLLMAKGDSPEDPTLKASDGAHAIYGALGLNVHPFRHPDPTNDGALWGLWASANGGATTTGGLFRGVVDGHLGYDFRISGGHFALGPAVGFVHVFQPDDALRPEDANVLLLGVHAVLDPAERHVEPERPKDRDGDGILDEEDACPDDPEDKDGFEDEDGCPEPDNDKDGVPDGADHCPNVPEDKDRFEDEDGCPDADNDKDGIVDEKDRCPNDPEDRDNFEDEDGCPDPDNDQDGIPDKEDLCPVEPETKNGYADEDGCPDEQQVRVVGEKIVLDDRVHFQLNSAVIREVSFPLLESVATILRKNPTYVHVEIEGHADQTGDEDFNKKLSENRAKSVLEFLVKHGIERKRLSAAGFGSSRLLVEKKNPRALFLNRRVEFVITREVQTGTGVKPPGAVPSSGQTEDTMAPPAPAPAAPQGGAGSGGQKTPSEEP